MTQLRTWHWLLLLTLASALIGEQSRPGAGLLLLICVSVMVKGWLVIDNLMNLRHCRRAVRLPMLAYFGVLLPAIALAVLFPEQLAALSSL
ncbi:hypothetical protein GCM10011348_03910 [Marinobacterium nitratireducens]|uniref:Thiosulfate reductase n=1 Tax=Marinobacterium nitratireducens TaxID=518897 RepID=A0A918DQ15_9GAMM|nr:hypothetical protein [Marinobacterium nitratireducens]GGO76516.1 hypothetical protein GCM10011348_03910 [Marinobacterium nitratireducens]